MSVVRGSFDLDRFRSTIVARFGLAFEDARADQLDGILERRAQANGATRATYLATIAGAPSSAELRALARELTVGETYFFRNKAQLDAFAEVVLPSRIKARAASKRLRFLSAGCSSGEEPYTLAMIAKEVLDPSFSVGIHAIDVNPTALERAARGVYSSWSLRETNEETKARWFRPQGRDFVLDPAIKKMVRFEESNLKLGDPSIWLVEGYDAIFCRNVIMYFTSEVAASVVERARSSLAPGGYLFLGHAETMRGLSEAFHLRHTHGTFYYQLGGDEEGPREVTDLREAVEEIGRSAARIEAIDERRSDPPPRPSQAPAPSARLDLSDVLSLAERERYNNALELLDARLTGPSHDPDALLLRAILLMQIGRLDEAETACGAMMRVRELDPGAHYVLAVCREGAGDSDGAAEHDRVAAYLDATFAMPRFHLGMLLRRQGDLAGARACFEEALALLADEDAARLKLFGGGFTRATLERACLAELRAFGARP